jgi:FkbM family methyltransferase
MDGRASSPFTTPIIPRAVTFIQLLNKLLRPAGVQICKKSKYRAVFGLDWIDDAADILKARGITPRIIMDIGANRGQTSKRLARGFPQAEVHCYEPTPASCEVLKRNLEKFPHAKAHALAFGPEKKMARFFLRAHHETNSFLQLEEPEAGSSPDSFIDVEMQCLDDYVPRQGWSDVHVLKINAEGYDLAILKGGSKLLKEGKIHLIFTEMNFKQLYQGQGGFTELHDFLGQLGYTLVGCYETASTATGESLWSNGLYVKAAA